MRAARRIKTDEEVAALRESIAVAESALAVTVSELRPGVTEQTLAGVLLPAGVQKVDDFTVAFHLQARRRQ